MKFHPPPTSLAISLSFVLLSLPLPRVEVADVLRLQPKNLSFDCSFVPSFFSLSLDV